MSRTLWSNILAKIKSFGRFFVFCEHTNNEASFLSAQKSRDAVSSKGLIVFFLLKGIPWGFFRASYSRSEVRPDNTGSFGSKMYQIFHHAIQDFASRRSFDEYRGPGIFDFLGFSSCKSPLDTSISRLP